MIGGDGIVWRAIRHRQRRRLSGCRCRRGRFGLRRGLGRIIGRGGMVPGNMRDDGSRLHVLFRQCLNVLTPTAAESALPPA